MIKSIKTPYSSFKIALSVASALMLLLAFPPFNFCYFAWVCFVPLLLIFLFSSRKESFFLAYISGVVFFLGALYWVTYVSVFGLFFLAAFFSLYFAVFGLLAHEILNRFIAKANVIVGVVFLALFWTALEFLRTYLPVFGFGWVLLCFSQTANLPFIQIADVFGSFGVSFLVMAINVFLFYLVTFFFKKRGGLLSFSICLFFLVSLVFLVNAYGYKKLAQVPTGDKVRLGVVQGNIAQADKWNPVLKNEIINKYSNLIEFISFDNPELIVLPEACYPGDFLRELPASRISQVIKSSGIPVLLGAIRLEQACNEFNSAVLLSGRAEIVSWYDKIKLVPFGEYIPAKPFFSILGLTKFAYSLGVGDFERGVEYTVFKYFFKTLAKEIHFSTLICFEDVFPNVSREFVKRGAQFLIVITNDAWFGRTVAPYQHLQASVFRAIENNRYLVRAANTGVSAFISPRGEVLDVVKDSFGNQDFVAGGLVREIEVLKEKSFFTRGGYLFGMVCFLFLLGWLLFLLKLNSNAALKS